MLKAISPSSSQSLLRRLTTGVSNPCPHVKGSRVPLLRFWDSLRNQNVVYPAYCQRFFCSESSGNGNSESGSGEGSGGSSGENSENVKGESGETVEEVPVKTSSAIVPNYPRPEDYLKDPKLLAALVENRKRSVPYAGAFLVKDESGTDASFVTGSEAEKNIYELKGESLYKRLHEVGTLAQVSEDPLTVKVDHLKHVGDFNFPRLADFGAAISGANKLQCQEVLEELDVYKRLKLTLELVKKEMEISKIQESIAKAIEEKISGEQRRYLLNEQLKAIKKELGLETDDKTALSGKFRERLAPNRERCPPHVLQVIEEELTKLQLLEASSSEFNVTRNYLDWLTSLPWGHYSLVGYITDEKMHIARDYLERTTREACGIKPEQVEITDEAFLALIETYCREAGVRNLQKHIEKIYRKIALQLVRKGITSTASADSSVLKQDLKELDNTDHAVNSIEEKHNALTEGNTTDESQEVAYCKAHSKVDEQSTLTHMSAEEPAKQEEPSVDSQDEEMATDIQEAEPKPSDEKIVVNASNLSEYVGKPVFLGERIYDQTPIGVVMGLAWTAMGGSTLYIETTSIEQGEGKGALQLTGQLGDVMKESALIAHTVARAILREKEPDNDFLANSKLHLHVPAGATPKDGPSAGCTMITSLLSLAMKKHVKKDVAMTGEVTLIGRVLPIGGVKEKTVAARRSGIKIIIFPNANKRDYDELAPNVKEGLEVHFVDEYSQIFNIAFGEEQEVEK